MKWYHCKALNKLFLETTDWYVAWKTKEGKEFKVIENPKGYWLADSLLFSAKGQDYLFVEAYDKKEKIGKIGVLTYKNNDMTNFRVVLERNYHLSYPFVFNYKDEFYMIPESSENNCIELYKAQNFPYDWVFQKELLKGMYVDTTLLKEENGTFKLFSYNVKEKKMISAILDMDKREISRITYKKDLQNELRAGGNAFKINKQSCRPFQSNQFFYGQSLSIKKVENLEEIMTITPEEIKNDKNIHFKRVHTFSSTDELEAIDLSNIRFDLLKIFKKIINKLYRRKK